MLKNSVNDRFYNNLENYVTSYTFLSNLYVFQLKTRVDVESHLAKLTWTANVLIVTLNFNSELIHLFSFPKTFEVTAT